MANQTENFQPDLDRGEALEVMRLVGEINEFKGLWRKLGEMAAERLARLRQATVIQSSGSSTRIEGAQLSDDEVARVLQGLRIDSFRDRDEAEVRGYGELLQTIFDHYTDIPLTENHLKQLHRILLGHSEKDAWHLGEYKKHPNDVEATYEAGRKEVVFRTAAPFDTPRRMEELVTTTNAALIDETIPPLVVIARFVVEFLAIHPFQDGNGRLARATTVLLLLRAGYEYAPYASLERLVEENKVAYYTALRQSQEAMKEKPHAFGPWLLFFLRMLHSHKRIVAGKLDVERSIVRLSDTQRQLLEVVEARIRVRTSDLVEQLGINRRTVQYHLETLVRLGLIEPHGERRGRYYTKATGEGAGPAAGRSWNGAVLAEILQMGGTITAEDLAHLLRRNGVPPNRGSGLLHGRRAAHLKRDPKTGRSVLTTRGREVAAQYLFAARLARTIPGAATGPSPQSE